MSNDKSADLHAAIEAALDALDIGRDAAQEVAMRYHEAMAGYRQDEHDRLDAEVEQIKEAINGLHGVRAALAAAPAQPEAWAQMILGCKRVTPSDRWENGFNSGLEQAAHVLRKAAPEAQQPEAWGIYAKVGSRWHLQHPTYPSKSLADASIRSFRSDDELEVRPLYAAPQN